MPISESSTTKMTPATLLRFAGLCFYKQKGPTTRRARISSEPRPDRYWPDGQPAHSSACREFLSMYRRAQFILRRTLLDSTAATIYLRYSDGLGPYMSRRGCGERRRLWQRLRDAGLTTDQIGAMEGMSGSTIIHGLKSQSTYAGDVTAMRVLLYLLRAMGPEAATILDMTRREPWRVALRQRVWRLMREWRGESGERLSYPSIAKVCGMESHGTVLTAFDRASRGGG